MATVGGGTLFLVEERLLRCLQHRRSPDFKGEKGASFVDSESSGGPGYARS